jgi:integrase
MSLGPAKGDRALNITEARDARVRFHASLLDGTARAPSVPAGKTFADALLAYLEIHAAAWKGGAEGDEAAAHRRLLHTKFAQLPLPAIDTTAVQLALAPWYGRPTSKKVRTKIKSVIDYAKALGWFTGDNPAAKETMGKLLPAVANVTHHPAMPWKEVPAFVAELAAFDAPASRALRFTILTAARTSETLGATWREIVVNEWIIPAGRMKEGKQHAVPLTPEALELLGADGDDDDLIFGRLHESAMRAFVRDRGCKVHGFRSTFTDWAAEHGHPPELREMAIAHAVGDDDERAYRRTNMIGRRREMMQAWAAFACSRRSLRLVASAS